jgi:iron(III) transport system substrate-binding protein
MKRSLHALILLLLSVMLSGFAQVEAKEVVIYTSLDQVFSEPILQDFEKQTGIQVKVVYDVEASKTTGLVNRLIAEKDYPKCDVFWNSEFAQTIVLKQKGVLAPYRSPSGEDIPEQFRDQEGFWTGYAARARVLIYDTRLLSEGTVPKSIFELTQPQWKGKVAMAYPLFGTAATHVAALYVALGEEKTQDYLKALKANAVLVVDGNAVARDVVVEGEVPVAFTDTDDVNVAVESGKPVKMVFPDHEGLGTLLIPTTVALVKGAPHPGEAKLLIDYLLSHEVEEKLAFAECAQIPVREKVKRPPNVPDIASIKVMAVDYSMVAEKMTPAARFCQSLFIR